MPHETTAVSAQVLCTPYNHAPCHFMQSHIHKVYACLAVTSHLHFRQNDQDLLCATVVTRGWNGYQNKSQHRKSTLEKKILPPFLQRFEPATFQSRVWRSNLWAIPAWVYACLTATCTFGRMAGVFLQINDSLIVQKSRLKIMLSDLILYNTQRERERERA